MAPKAISQQQNGGKGNPTPPASNAVEIFDDALAARYVGGISARAIRDWRTRRGLPFIRVTAKVCRIRKTDLDRWLDRQKTSITRGGA
jgi:hypothetical protein